MTALKLWLCAGSAAAGVAFAGVAFADDQTTPPPAAAPAAAPAAPAAPAPTPMANPAMSPTISANGSPAIIDAGPFGKIMVDGVISGLAFYQDNSAYDAFGNHTPNATGDLSNGQIIVNKSDGFFQFYFQAGVYSVPVLGEPYYKSTKYDNNTFGYVPQGFVKLVPNANFSVEIGALPTLIGDEYTFTFQNYNIERGLLWNQEPAVSKGVQLNYTKGPWAFSFAVTDGYDSGAYSTLSGLATYTFKNSDTLAVAASGNVTTPKVNTFLTPAQQNDGTIWNLIYSHTSGPWTLSPYVQYNTSQYVPNGVSFSGQTMGVALLGKYSFNSLWNLGGRIEWVGAQGDANLLGYGRNSNALTLTLTPTFQKGIFFARGEASFVLVGNGVRGEMFGSTGADDSQARIMFETGVAF
jgi:hypothetical protein